MCHIWHGGTPAFCLFYPITTFSPIGCACANKLTILLAFAPNTTATFHAARRTVPIRRPLSEADNALLITAVEPKARKATAKAHCIGSGAIPVLAAIHSKRNLGGLVRPRDIYALGIANMPLIRAYIRQLIDTKFVSLHIIRGVRWLSPTLEGMAVVGRYAREMRSGSRALQKL